jgi:hypothetical protein
MQRSGHHHRARRRPSAVVVVLLLAVPMLAGFVFVRVLQRPSGARVNGDPPVSHAPRSAMIIAVDSDGAGTPRPSHAVRTSTRTSASPSTSASRTALLPPHSAPVHRPTDPSVHTPEGMWWGVDSTLPISATTLANVRGWYRGAPRPQFWGRYLRGSYGVSRAELAFARAQHIYVYLIVSDRNCSQCGGGDVCGNDRTRDQSRTDALAAAAASRRLRLPLRTTLFKDIEQVSSCRGEPTADYLLGWYATMRHTGFRTGFYGNVHKQYYDFPVAYCRALTRDASLGTDVVLDMNEDEPLIGAPRGTTGPHDAPRFDPNSPRCAPRSATKIWQYGESLTAANLTDIDQARPDTAGLLAPDGSVTG